MLAFNKKKENKPHSSQSESIPSRSLWYININHNLITFSFLVLGRLKVALLASSRLRLRLTLALVKTLHLHV